MTIASFDIRAPMFFPGKEFAQLALQ